MPELWVFQMRLSAVLALAAAITLAPAARAADAAVAATRWQNLVLLQSERVIHQRASSPEAVVDYLTRVQAATDAAATALPATPSTGYLVIGVRPGGRSRVWLDFEPALPAESAARLRAAAEAVPPFAARHGVVVVALGAALWGGGPGQSLQPLPSPAEFRATAAAAGRSLEVGQLVDRLWPADVEP